MSLGSDTGQVSRRTFIGGTLIAGGMLLLDLDALAAETDTISHPFPGGKFVKIVPFLNEMHFPAGKLFDSELDGRKYADLSKLTPKNMLVPADEFYVRTACSELLKFDSPWQIKIVPKNGEPHLIPATTVEKMSADMGVHLMECSGNERGGEFGLMSACRWSGIPLLKFLHHVHAMPGVNQRVCVSGFDTYSKPSGVPGLRPSIPGASWIFSLADLKSTGAFLATGMNGKPLPRDHGYPLRLVVPGWYGCTCIKWVNEIALVDDDAPSTDQMKEFAGRTHQEGVPSLARDFKAPAIDQAAMPIRVEQWDVNGRPMYNVVGIMWGGHRPTRDLQIRFSPHEKYQAVEDYDQQTNATWTLWSFKWSPEVTGTYTIQLKIADPTIPTKRLDKGYYVRTLNISQL